MWRKIVDTLVLPLAFVAVAVTLSLCVARRVARDEERIAHFASLTEEKTLISQYDKMFQEVGEQYDVDWLLLSAIARAESEFRFDAVSKAGAVGLMQIMPSVARNMGYDREQLFDPRISAEIAAQLLHENNAMLRLPEGFDSAERVKFILACYNAGYSRIADARRLARYHEESGSVWSVVATYLELLAEPEYVELDIVRSGVFYGSAETIAYVNRVMHIYNIYKNRIIPYI